MTRILHCRDAGFDCNAVIEGATDEDILNQVRAHAAADHNVEVTPELAEAVAAKIQDE